MNTTEKLSKLAVLSERLEQTANNALRSADGFWSLNFGRGKRQSRAWGALSRDIRSCAAALRDLSSSIVESGR